MQVQSYVQSAAAVIRVTEVRPGNIYKRLVKSTYSGDRDKLMFGIVTDVMNNGEDTAISALEFVPPMYGGTVKPEVKVFSGSTDVVLFPAVREEWDAHLSAAIDKQRDEVSRTEDTLAGLRSVLSQMVNVMEGERTLPPVTNAPAVDS